MIQLNIPLSVGNVNGLLKEANLNLYVSITRVLLLFVGRPGGVAFGYAYSVSDAAADDSLLKPRFK